ncbi:dolichol phosphate-mannose biosynthesis regulatory [Lipomyces japonicus]|uniref:dolichol phosphate-mannose biosynthesis regulatory n=1 Tax=Lipomyces japonicus TaxID=56871 RepID=UPI0034CFFA28
MAVLYFATFLFLYYTIWVSIMPFVDATHPIQKLFSSREWAIRIPVLILLIAAGVLGSFIGVVMIRSNNHKIRRRRAK